MSETTFIGSACAWSQPYVFNRDDDGMASSVEEVQVSGRWGFDGVSNSNWCTLEKSKRRSKQSSSPRVLALDASTPKRITGHPATNNPSFGSN